MLQLSLLSAVLLSSALFAGFSAAVGWRHREVSGSLAFVATMVFVAQWSLCYAVQLLFTDLDVQLLWENPQYVGGFLGPVGLFVFTLHYTGRGELITRRRLAALCAPGLAAATFVWIPALRPLVRADAELVRSGGQFVLDATFGPLFFAVLAYTYVLIVVSLGLMVVAVVRAPSFYRRQALLVTVGAVVPTAASMVSYVLDLVVIDLTPVALSVFGLTFAFALTRYRLLNVRPVARDQVVKQINEGIVVTGPDDRVVDVNPAAAGVLDLDESIGRPLTAAGSDRAATLTSLDEGETGELVVGDDPARYFEVRRSAVDTPHGVGRGTLYILHDVTARRARERWFVSLTEHSTDVITVLDADLEVAYASPSVETVLGYDVETVEGRNVLESIHPEDRAEVRQAMLDGADPARVSYRAMDAEGSWRTLESRSKNRLSDPVVSGIVVTTRDVTESEARKRELERRNERLDSFASVVSHDLRNPLSVAAGFTEIAREEPSPEHFDRIEEAHDRMGEIIEDVLALARSGRSVSDPVPVDVESVARSAWSQVVTEGATLTVAGSATLSADPGRLKQLFENLFRNSVEHSSTGSRTKSGDSVEHGSTSSQHPDDADDSVEHGGDGVSVTVGPLSDGFYVEDDGPGIPETERDQVFDSGFSTGEDGTGVGLAIVDSIAEGHGWTVAATEAEGGGARFEIRGVD